MSPNPDILVPIFRVESQGHINTFVCIDTATAFLRAEAKDGHTPLNLSVSTIRHSDYLEEVESQENRPVKGQETPPK